MFSLIPLTLLFYTATVGVFSVKAYPAVIMAGGTTYITCRVPRHVDNRWVEWGIENYHNSGRQLDGIHAMVTHKAMFQNIPCDSGDAYCTVTDNMGKTKTIRAAFTVANCDGR